MVTLVEFLLARIQEDEAAVHRMREIPAFNVQCPCGATGRITVWGTAISIAHHVGYTPQRVDSTGWIHPGGEPQTVTHVLQGDQMVEFAVSLPVSPRSARVLAECEAKRRIIDLHWPGNGYECPVCARPEDYDEDSEGNYYHYRSAFFAPCPTLHALALPYAGHPEYQTEWAA